MGRTACTEPQCLYKGALYLYLYMNIDRRVITICYTRTVRFAKPVIPVAKSVFISIS